MLDAGDYDRNGLQEVYFWLTEGTAYLRQHLHRMVRVIDETRS